MDILWMYAGMKRTHRFNFSFLPEMVSGGDSLAGTPTITYSPNDGNLTIGNIVIVSNFVYADYSPNPNAAGQTYSITCNVATTKGEQLKMIGQLQVF